jgi:hypothetical protein
VNFQWNGSSLNRPNLVSDPFKAGIVPANTNTRCQYLPSQIDPVTNLPGLAAPAVHTLSNWFNPCAFEAAPAGELGNSPRSPLSGPRFVNTDMSFVKHIALPYEGMRLDFRAEFFNMFNHPHFYLPGSAGVSGMQDISAPASFGVINTTLNDPRFVQLALKLVF